MPIRKLFGGALELLVPDDYIDVSELRQVPDQQEVFVQVDSDASLIVELVEEPATIQLPLAEFYFKELAADNGARSKSITTILEVPSPIPQSEDPSSSATILEGIQTIAKFNTDNFTPVHIWMAIVRVPRVKSDILVTWNDPTASVSKERFMEALGSLKLLDWGLFIVDQ